MVEKKKSFDFPSRIDYLGQPNPIDAGGLKKPLFLSCDGLALDASIFSHYFSWKTGLNYAILTVAWNNHSLDAIRSCDEMNIDAARYPNDSDWKIALE